MNYPRQRLSYNPMQPDVMCIAQLQFAFSQNRINLQTFWILTLLSILVSRDKTVSKILGKKKMLLQIPTDKQTTKHYISCAWCCSTEYRLYKV